MADENIQEAEQMEVDSSDEFDTPEPRSGGFRWVVTIIVIAVIVIGGLWLVSKYSKFNILNLGAQGGDWQAVFLTNGQVYFGKISKETSSTLVLSEIYYLQVTQPLQRSGDQNENAQGQNELALVKLGNELHGPKDEMRINKDHVLFTENLKDESKVVKAIEDSKAQTQ